MSLFFNANVASYALESNILQDWKCIISMLLDENPMIELTDVDATNLVRLLCASAKKAVGEKIVPATDNRKQYYTKAQKVSKSFFWAPFYWKDLLPLTITNNGKFYPAHMLMQECASGLSPKAGPSEFHWVLPDEWYRYAMCGCAGENCPQIICSLLCSFTCATF